MENPVGNEREQRTFVLKTDHRLPTLWIGQRGLSIQTSEAQAQIIVEWLNSVLKEEVRRTAEAEYAKKEHTPVLPWVAADGAEWPDDDELVIVWCIGDDWFFGKRRGGYKPLDHGYHWLDEGGSYVCEDIDITHWMRIEGPGKERITL